MSDSGQQSDGEPPPAGFSSLGPGRLLAIGDIHGCARPLEALIDTLRPTSADTFVVLGDFINRGPASSRVIELLIALQSQTRLIAILGNHEEELLAARYDSKAEARWLAMGGQATLASYAAEAGLSDIPAAHWQFIEAALPWWECEGYFFTHANYRPELPLAEQAATELRWLSLSDAPPQPHCSGKIAIVGHTPNLAGHVVDFGFLRCLDTGCGLGGKLTVMDVESRQIWQCAEESHIVVWGDDPDIRAVAPRP
jgi:serine/threonine protein phosphatase 1